MSKSADNGLIGVFLHVVASEDLFEDDVDEEWV